MSINLGGIYAWAAGSDVRMTRFLPPAAARVG